VEQLSNSTNDPVNNWKRNRVELFLHGTRIRENDLGGLERTRREKKKEEEYKGKTSWTRPASQQHFI
jgi:hypothetical protein